jgi:hypothetical protein
MANEARRIYTTAPRSTVAKRVHRGFLSAKLLRCRSLPALARSPNPRRCRDHRPCRLQPWRRGAGSRRRVQQLGSAQLKPGHFARRHQPAATGATPAEQPPTCPGRTGAQPASAHQQLLVVLGRSGPRRCGMGEQPVLYHAPTLLTALSSRAQPGRGGRPLASGAAHAAALTQTR